MLIEALQLIAFFALALACVVVAVAIVAVPTIVICIRWLAPLIERLITR